MQLGVLFAASLGGSCLVFSVHTPEAACQLQQSEGRFLQQQQQQQQQLQQQLVRAAATDIQQQQQQLPLWLVST